MEDLKPHNEYKDSSLPWLGKVPAHWTLRRAKLLYREIDERSQTGEETLCSVSHKTGVTPRKANVTMFMAESTVGYKICRPGDLAINTLWAYMAALGVAREIGIVSPAYGVYRPRIGSPLLPEYADRLLRIEQYKHEYIARSTGVNASRLRLYPDQFLQIPILLPPPGEQAAIVRFLAALDRRVNRFVRAKRRLIELLTEQKQALITRAVTRGLNPNAKRKPSGITFLGDVPDGWRVLPLKRWVATKITDGPHETPPLLDEGVDFVSAESMVDGRIVFERRRGFISRDLHDTYCRKCRPTRNDIFMCKSGATTGKVAFVDTDRQFSVWSPLALVRCRTDFAIPKLMFLVLGSKYVQQQVQDRWSYGTQPNLSMAAMERIVVTLPTALSEQEVLLSSIEESTRPNDSAIALAQGEIALLWEYRTRLVADVVTGKLDVRAATQRLSEEGRPESTCGSITADEGHEDSELTDEVVDDSAVSQEG